MPTWRDPDAVAVARDALGELGQLDAPLGARTTYRVGGPAALLAVVASPEDLAVVAEARRLSGLDVLVVGKGSNMLVADRGFEGIAVVLGDPFTRIEIDDGVVVAGGAVALPVLARRTVAEGLRGLEWAVGVPGSVGGAVRMNAGGHGSDIAASLLDATVFDLETAEQACMRASSLRFGYRSSAVSSTEIVTGARFRTTPGDRAEGERLLAEIVQWRRANQPGGQNAGSVFVNPDGTSAGAEIDRAGLKGMRLGSAHVSAKHANFIQADENGRAQDVSDLMDHVASVVGERRGVALHTEIRRIGFEVGSGTVDSTEEPS